MDSPIAFKYFISTSAYHLRVLAPTFLAFLDSRNAESESVGSVDNILDPVRPGFDFAGEIC